MTLSTLFAAFKMYGIALPGLISPVIERV